jgi:toxin ParE1/3/4
MFVEWTEPAVDDLDEIVRYIFTHYDPSYAFELEDYILDCAERLCEFPYKGKKGDKDGTRKYLIDPNYWLIYEVTDRISILNVVHTRKLYPFEEF